MYNSNSSYIYLNWTEQKKKISIFHENLMQIKHKYIKNQK